MTPAFAVGARASLAALVLACTGESVLAGQIASPPPFTRPGIRVVRIDTAEAPVIDADLSDAAWEKAAVIDDFTQRSPNPYEPATERTVVRILYDENNLYISFYRASGSTSRSTDRRARSTIGSSHAGVPNRALPRAATRSTR